MMYRGSSKGSHNLQDAAKHGRPRPQHSQHAQLVQRGPTVGRSVSQAFQQISPSPFKLYKGGVG